MAHSLDIQWPVASNLAANVSRGIIGALNSAEEAYQDLLEAVGGRSDTDFAKQLFDTTTPTQEEIDKVADLKAAMVACHQLYQAANSTAIATDDRMSKLRRLA